MAEYVSYYLSEFHRYDAVKLCSVFRTRSVFPSFSKDRLSYFQKKVAMNGALIRLVNPPTHRQFEIEIENQNLLMWGGVSL